MAQFHIALISANDGIFPSAFDYLGAISQYDALKNQPDASPFYLVVTDGDTHLKLYNFTSVSVGSTSSINESNIFDLGIDIQSQVLFQIHDSPVSPFMISVNLSDSNHSFISYVDISVYFSQFFIDWLSTHTDVSSVTSCLEQTHLDTLKADLLGALMPKFGQLRGDITSLGGDLSSDIGDLTSHISSEVSNLNTGLQNSISNLHTYSSTKFSSIDTKLDNLEFPAVDLSTLDTKLNSLDTKMDINHGLIQSLTADFDLDGVVNSVKSFNFASLNGSSGSFPDGTDVLVTGYTAVFKVVASQFYLSATQTQRIVYLLENSGKRFLVPETAVRLPELAPVE